MSATAIRYLVIYPGGRISRQVCLDDVFTHIKLRRESGNDLPLRVERLALELHPLAK